VLARISGEVGTLCTILLSVYSGTCLPIFIEIGSYLTDTEQKISWHSFFETRCTYLNAVLLKMSEVGDDKLCFAVYNGSLIVVMHIAAAITGPRGRCVDCVIIKQRRVQL